jgi:hypothetical protein
VELFNKESTSGKVSWGFPSVVIRSSLISFPFHKVLDFLVDAPAVDHSGNFIFEFLFDFYRRRWRLSSVWDGVVNKWFQ